MRVCANCRRNLPMSSYTGNQYVKGIGTSRCVGCVHGHHSDTPSAIQSSSGRYNNSEGATITLEDLDNPFAEGCFRYVAKGTYTSGDRNGQPSVHKWFKTGGVFEADYFLLDIKAVEKALELVNRFNDLKTVSKNIKINVPSVWTFSSSSRRAGQKVLTEPFIQGYQKFNSNTGWANDSQVWGEVMQALSHFTYHVTGGQFVLCDLQGGIYQHEVVLSDPVILSRNREYGVTDLGPEGISSFFSQHRCNNYCWPNWTRPFNAQRNFAPMAGTAMIRHSVPTVRSRPLGTNMW